MRDFSEVAWLIGNISVFSSSSNNWFANVMVKRCYLLQQPDSGCYIQQIKIWDALLSLIFQISNDFSNYKYAPVIFRTYLQSKNLCILKSNITGMLSFVQLPQTGNIKFHFKSQGAGHRADYTLLATYSHQPHHSTTIFTIVCTFIVLLKLQPNCGI